MKKKVLSIIIPISLNKDNSFLLSRLEKLLVYFINFKSYDFELIISDSSLKKIHSTDIHKLCEASKNIIYTYIKSDKLYSAAKARNHAVNVSNGKYILFYDVDLIINNSFLEKIFIDIKNFKSINEFKIYPCLYLSESITKIIEKSTNSLEFNKIKLRYLEGYNDEVLYLAVNTSTILLNKNYFLSIGSYNENFKGHGYEDFELIHRLCINNQIINIGSDYVIDFKTQFPAEYKGFRKYYAYYSLPNFFKDAFTLHLWHARPLNKKYYRNRKDNAIYFIDILKHDIINLKDKKELIDLNYSYIDYINNLLEVNGYDRKKYFGFYALNQVSLKKKNKKSYIKKIRKLFLNPNKFFVDMKLFNTRKDTNKYVK